MIIETERLILRPFRESDAEDLYGYLHEPTVHCFLCMKLDTMEDARQAAIERAREPEEYLAVEFKKNGRVIGEIFFHGEATAQEGVRDTFSPCWMLSPEYFGNGYMYEAAEAVYDHLFEKRSARRIYLYTEDYNIPCQKLSEKLGMRREGVFLEYVAFMNDNNGDPVYENTCQYAILKKEWELRKEKRHG